MKGSDCIRTQDFNRHPDRFLRIGHLYSTSHTRLVGRKSTSPTPVTTPVAATTRESTTTAAAESAPATTTVHAGQVSALGNHLLGVSIFM
jgi:hypothetical protein